MSKFSSLLCYTDCRHSTVDMILFPFISHYFATDIYQGLPIGNADVVISFIQAVIEAHRPNFGTDESKCSRHCFGRVACGFIIDSMMSEANISSPHL